MIHELKILPEFFKAVKKDKKTFEIRTNDRPFKVNDHIILKEWTENDYTGEQVKVRIKYILDDENYLLKNTVAMSIEILDENIYPSATTEININYYEELKANADKWVEKETPIEPINCNKSYNPMIKLDYQYGRCKCGHEIFNFYKYCSYCGQSFKFKE